MASSITWKVNNRLAVRCPRKQDVPRISISSRSAADGGLATAIVAMFTSSVIDGRQVLTLFRHM